MLKNGKYKVFNLLYIVGGKESNLTILRSSKHLDKFQSVVR